MSPAQVPSSVVSAGLGVFVCNTDTDSVPEWERIMLLSASLWCVFRIERWFSRAVAVVWKQRFWELFVHIHTCVSAQVDVPSLELEPHPWCALGSVSTSRRWSISSLQQTQTLFHGVFLIRLIFLLLQSSSTSFPRQKVWQRAQPGNIQLCPAVAESCGVRGSLAGVEEPSREWRA